jgi:hypothetical protein
VRIFLSTPVQLAAIQRKAEKEQETGEWEMYYPARIACGNPLHLLAKQVEGGAVEAPPITHTPFQQFEAIAVDL